MLLSFGLLSVVMKSLPVGTAYTVRTAIGAMGTFLVGVVILSGALSAILIIFGLVLMKIFISDLVRKRHK
ncbi:multidrug transporter EmrE-like cation transporter [Gluconobacter cerinus]|nr:multidrug transporter EmrE-like cation transporter [Gluconobacter cerinus]